MAPYLDPLNQALVDQFATQPPIENLTPQEFRALFEQLQRRDKPIPGVTRTSLVVPFEDGVKTFVFKKDGVKKSEVLPVVLYLHGGAWIAGDVKGYDSICRDLALQTGYAVVFVEYTLAPEARYPTQQEQCYAVLKWVREYGTKKGLSQDKIAIVGDSAGCQLTIATTILASTRTPKIPISYQILLHPAISNFDADRQTRSEFEFFEGPILTVPFCKKSYAIYVPDAEDRDDELAAPINITAAHAKLQPPTLIINSAVDPLRDDGKRFGEILQTNGIDCAVLTTHGQVHDSEILELTRGGPTPRAVVRMVAGSIVDALKTNDAGAGKREVDEPEAKLSMNGHGKGKEEVKTRKRRRTRGSY